MEKVETLVKTLHEEKKILVNLPDCKQDIINLLNKNELFVIHTVRARKLFIAKQFARLSMK
jgi:hypothetical protein